MRAAVLLTTLPDLKTAKRLAFFLVKERLAACVSIKEGFTSVYRWNKKIETAREVLLLVKIPREKFLKVAKAIEAKHPYELPEIILLPVCGSSKRYLSWLKSSVA